jgi:predicted DNA-binding protein YlxM (UPF0122 family)
MKLSEVKEMMQTMSVTEVAKELGIDRQRLYYLLRVDCKSINVYVQLVNYLEKKKEFKAITEKKNDV